MSDLVLANIDKASKLLAQAKTVQEAKQIADVAEAARVYAKRVESSIKTVNYAAEIKIRAERLLGEMLAQSPKNKGARGVGKSVVVQCDRTPKLRDIKISKDQSARSQKLARIPVQKFEQALDERKTSGREITTAGVLRVLTAPAESEDSDEVCWRRGLLYRANDAAAGAAFEDWSKFRVDSQLLKAAEKAARAWGGVADYLRKLNHEQKQNRRAA